MLFTSHRLYYDNGMLEKKGNVTYKQISDNGTIPSAVLEVHITSRHCWSY